MVRLLEKMKGGTLGEACAARQSLRLSNSTKVGNDWQRSQKPHCLPVDGSRIASRPNSGRYEQRL